MDYKWIIGQLISIVQYSTVNDGALVFYAWIIDVLLYHCIVQYSIADGTL
jgi:hypothetical protein